MMRQAPTSTRPPSVRIRSGIVIARTPRIRRIVEDMLAMADIQDVEYVPDDQAAILKLRYGKRSVGFVLCEADEQLRHHLAVAKYVRWDGSFPSTELPVVAIGDGWTLPMVTKTRDAGITEVIGMPITNYAFMRRFVSALHQERPFIRAASYHGPDRRMRPKASYEGPWRRSSDKFLSQFDR
jgi:two-component system chemotaxis response regulator CheY